MEDEIETFRRRQRVNYQSISLFHVFNLRSDFIISDSMWCFLKVILTYCNPLNILRCLKYEVILIYYMEFTNHIQQIFELLLTISVSFPLLIPLLSPYPLTILPEVKILLFLQ